MADHHRSESHPPGSVAGRDSDSFSDNIRASRPFDWIDGRRPLDSDAPRVRTDIPERLERLLPGEAALVYQCLRDRLATLFDDAGH